MHQLLQRRVRVIGWAVLLVLLILAAYDILSALAGTADQRVVDFIPERIGLVALLVVGLVLLYRWPWLAERPRMVAWLGTLALLAMVNLTIFRLGGVHSPQFAGLITIMMIWAFVIPTGWTRTAIICVLIMASYCVSVISANGWPVLGHAAFCLQTTILALGTILACLTNWLVTRAQRDRQWTILERQHWSDHDPLTGCLNRRRVDDVLATEFERATRYSGQLVLLMLDIDDFKQVNDNLGHQAGDEVLRRLGLRLSELLGEGGQIGRFGGEEFIVFLPHTTVQQACKLADTIQTSLRNTPIPVGQATVSLTLSMGLSSTEYEPRAANVSELLNRADAAMLQAKKSGKDRLVVYDSAIPLVGRATDRVFSPDLERHAIEPESDPGSDRWFEEVALVGFQRWALFGAGLMLGFALLDIAMKRLMFPDLPLGQFLLMRAAVVGLLLLIAYAIEWLPYTKKRVVSLHIGSSVFVALALSYLTLKTGEAQSLYFTSVMLWMVVVALTLPGAGWYGILSIFLISASWPTLLLLSGVPLDSELLVRMMRIAILGLVAAITYWELNKTRTKELRMRDRLARLATLDGLTGLQNHRGFENRFAAECRRARRQQLPLSLILFDLDQLKQLNDEHGHVVGDRALTGIANLVRAQIRAVDMAARLGGDEFALLLPMTASREAANLADRLRRSISSLCMPTGDGEASLSASFGIAECTANSTTVKQIRERADRALYHAKEAGRNRVALWFDDQHLATLSAAPE